LGYSDRENRERAAEGERKAGRLRRHIAVGLVSSGFFLVMELELQGRTSSLLLRYAKATKRKANFKTRAFEQYAYPIVRQEED
jgi:hypothetical protein